MEVPDSQNSSLQEMVTVPRISRRDFLKLAGLVSASALAEIAPPIIRHVVSEVSGTPDINLMFFQEYHSQNDTKTKRFKEMFDRADVYITEIGPWDDSTLDWYRNSKNTKEIDGTWSIVGRSEKPIFFIDPGKDSTLWKDLEIIYEKSKPDYNLDFQSSLSNLSKYLYSEVEIHNKREFVWKEQLADILEKVSVSGSGYRPNLNIMIHTGAYHTKFYHDINKTQKNGTLTTERIFSENPFTLPIRHEMMRRILFLKHDLTNVDLGKCMAELLVYDSDLLDSKKYSESLSLKHKTIRNIVNRLSLDEINSIYDKFASISKDVNKEEDAKKLDKKLVIMDLLEAKKINLE